VRIVLYSGGALSWAAAMRTIERHGRDDVRLLFTDTAMEDEDLYRFLDDSERQLGVPLIRLKDGRTPWDVFREKRMLGNTRIDLCSRVLKREMSQRWLAENAPGATLVFGIDWEETHRLDGLQRRYGEQGYTVEAPMTDRPWMTKAEVFRWMKDCGLAPPRLYDLGFAHNNCGGFCVRAGHAHFAQLLATMPERYREHEANEADLRERLGKNVSILRDREWGETRPMTLKEFRERIERGDVGQLDMFGIGGCGCFVDAA
jgi:3'-phosphoadenosine 5'-phosphosulfate sulfotransferase (PAPS reductase)/FAD synthetase